MENELIYIGGIGQKDEFVGGELTKNKIIIEALEKSQRKVYKVDTFGARKHLWKLLRIPFVLLLHPKLPVIVSTNLGNIYWLFRIWSALKTRRVVSFIGTGGAFSQWLRDGRFDSKKLLFLNLIVVQGNKMRAELDQAGLHKHRILLNNKYINHIPTINVSKKSCSKVRFVFLSRMQPEKGVDMIVECAEKLNREGFKDSFSITFYGKFEDSYVEVFNSKTKPISNIEFKGVLNLREDSGYDELAAYDVMLFPTYWKGEGFPGVVIDALIAGLPIIISDWNFNADYVIPDKTGKVIAAKNKEQLYDAMLDVIKNKDKYTTMSAYCQHMAKEFDTRKVISEDFFKALGV